ncbi:MAG: cadherin-like beta sandwich domain-containing protein [Bacteroidia bacterium]
MKQNLKISIHQLLLVITLLVVVNAAFAQAPTITSFSPDSGSIGTLVTIIGTNLNSLDTIKIGEVSAIKISATSNSLVAMVMPGAITGNIYLRNSSGNVTSDSDFTIVANIPPTTQQGNKLVGSGAVINSEQVSSVSVSADGNTAVIGDLSDSNNKGAAWVLTKNNGIWNQQGVKLVGTGSVGINVYQGYAVSISADGNTVIVGGFGDNNNLGAAWIYKRSNGNWSQQGGKLVGTGNIGSSFQGSSVSLSGDGNTAIVGGSYDNNGKGAVWVYTSSNGVWSQQGNKLVGSGSVGVSIHQGNSVSISSNGNTVMVGGYGDNYDKGAIWVFTRSAGIWSQQGNKIVGTGSIGIAYQGFSVSISSNGNSAIVGGIYDNGRKGAVWFYSRNGGVWSQQGDKIVSNESSGTVEFRGYSVGLSADGSTAVVGAKHELNSPGAVWVYKRIGNIWIQQGGKLISSSSADVVPGNSVSISSDGNTALVGGVFQNGALVFSASANANLVNITLSNGLLNPVFDSTTLSYSASVNNAISSVTVIPTNADSNATNQIRVNGGMYEPVYNGVMSSVLLLNIGSNKIDIKVTAQNRTYFKTYSVMINRNLIAPSAMSYLPTSVVATRTITNINSSVTYSGDSIASFSINPALPKGVSLNTSTGLISGIPTVTLPQTVFTITGTNNGGSTTASFTLTVNPVLAIQKVNNIIFSNTYFKPNPFANTLEIYFESYTKETTKLIIMDAVGKEVFAKNIQSTIGNNNITIDEMAHLKSGFYFARLANNNGISKAFKLVKE